MDDTNIIVAIISAIVSILTLVIVSMTKPFWEKYFYKFKLKTDHENEQRKKIKFAISKHKVSLLDSAESLNHRLYNFSGNCIHGWHTNPEEHPYYLESFTYRFISFFAECRQSQLQMVYLDSTVSDKSDLEFIKSLKLFPQFFCDTKMFEGQSYGLDQSTDHFYKNNFIEIVDSLLSKDGVLSFKEFKLLEYDKKEKIYSYLKGISQDKSCLKWYSLNSFHFALMGFLNEYGYDFQKTSKQDLSELSMKNNDNILLDNVIKILAKNCLPNSSQITKSITHLNKSKSYSDVCSIVWSRLISILCSKKDSYERY